VRSIDDVDSRDHGLNALTLLNRDKTFLRMVKEKRLFGEEEADDEDTDYDLLRALLKLLLAKSN
jgi:hypothetical protein